MKTGKNVIQPMRFVDAYCDFTPIQKDFIMLVQFMTSKQQDIRTDFVIDLKPYFRSKDLNIDAIRPHHYKEVTDDLMKSKVTFKYLKGDTLYSMHNLFSHCVVNSDLELKISIIDDVLPLFYINKLEEGHFQDNRLVKELFQKSYPDYDRYISYHPKTYVDFPESQTKKLFEKLLQFRRLKKYTYELAKDELYLLLGYGYLKDKEDQSVERQLFRIVGQEFIQTTYQGVGGWKNLRVQLNKWLKEISDKNETGIKVIKKGKNYFSTRGRPVRSIFIQVEFDHQLIALSEKQEKAYMFLEPYGLSQKQKIRIVNDFAYEQISKRVLETVVAMKDNGIRFYADNRAVGIKKIDNVPGFIYGIVFGYGKRK